MAHRNSESGIGAPRFAAYFRDIGRLYLSPSSHRCR